MDRTENAWQESRTRMMAAESDLRAAILRISESRLDEPGIPGGDSVYILLQGAVQHSLYHAGQIILLKRFWTALLKTPAP
jgi:hypothetical protein